MTINVTERNFDANLITASIKNDYNGNIPNISFQNLSATEHKDVISFSEGDYSFDIKGTDLGGHSAEVNLDYEKLRRFYVDETAPLVEENFDELADHKKNNYLNVKKTAVIKTTEHNFDHSIQEVDNPYIGYFWLWIIIVSVIVVAIGAVLGIFFVRKRKNN